MAGMIVQTKTGDIGQTIKGDDFVNGKVKVYLLKDNKKILCDPKTLVVIGYYH